MKNVRLELSETGRARRNQMLEELKLSVGENHRRKKRRRTGVAIAVLLTASSLAGWQLVRQSQEFQVASEQYESNEALLSQNLKVQPTDATASEAQQTDEQKQLDFGLVSGDEILDLLNEIGQPSALAEINSEWIAIPLVKKSPGQQ